MGHSVFDHNFCNHNRFSIFFQCYGRNDIAERDYATFRSLLPQIRLSSVCIL